MPDARPMKKVILIPHWVHETLARRKLSLSGCLDFGIIQPLSSVNDLACFLCLQRTMRDLTGLETAEGDLLNPWMESAREEQKTLLMQTILPLADLPATRLEVRDRLFSPQSRLPHYADPFTTHDITREVAGVVVNPGFFSEESGFDGYRAALIVATLKILYAYNAPHQVSRTPLFQRYLGLLSARQLMV